MEWAVNVFSYTGFEIFIFIFIYFYIYILYFIFLEVKTIVDP